MQKAPEDSRPCIWHALAIQHQSRKELRRFQWPLLFLCLFVCVCVCVSDRVCSTRQDARGTKWRRWGGHGVPWIMEDRHHQLRRRHRVVRLSIIQRRVCHRGRADKARGSATKRRRRRGANSLTHPTPTFPVLLAVSSKLALATVWPALLSNHANHSTRLVPAYRLLHPVDGWWTISVMALFRALGSNKEFA